jgi:hypothetical protein
MKKNRVSSEVPTPGVETRTVRERTLAHMESLMRTATTVGAGLVLACAAKAQTPKAPQVVDCLPPPVGYCENPDKLILRGCLIQQTRWVKSGMRWTLQLRLSALAGPTQLDFEGVKREVIKVSGVSIKDLKVERGGLAFVLAAGASSRQANMQFPVLCNDKKITLKLNLDLSKAPVENGSVPVRLVK